MSANNPAYALLDRAEDLVDKAKRALRATLGLTREARILPMKGFGAPRDGVRILARVLEDRRQGGPKGGRWRRAFRRWATLEVPDQRVVVRWKDRTWEVRSDEEGYVDVTVPVPDRCEPGWHELELCLVDSAGAERAHTSLRAMVVGAEHELGVISDIDDTVIDTGVSNTLNLVKGFIYELPAEKEPFPGIDELYRALHRGPDGEGKNPIFYVSSSPMNLYEHLERTFDQIAMPEGPLLLRDWGFDHHGLSPDGGHEHKRDKALAILEQTGDLRFVLIGDSGQHDPELYRQVVEEHPERIAAVAIRDVAPDPRDEEVARIGEAIEAAGVPFLAADNTTEIARFLAERGLVVESAIAEVAAEVDAA